MNTGSWLYVILKQYMALSAHQASSNLELKGTSLALTIGRQI